MGKIKFTIFLLLCCCAIFKIPGQNLSQAVPITNVLEDISKLHGVTFNYESDLLISMVVIPVSNNLSLKAKIENLEKQTDLVIEQISNSVYAISRIINICGYLKESESQSPIPSATITTESSYNISDKEGYFEIQLRSVNDLITIRHLGFATIKASGSDYLSEDCTVVFMSIQEEQISPVLIKTYLVKGIDKREDWTTSIDYARFSLLPGLIESDVLQTAQALPGITSADETVSNINIRGGSNDQNLILWDGIKMYQTGHFFGLISSFNPLMTQTASVIRNGSDVALTDGVSGTIHIQTDKQIDSKFNGAVGINLLNAEIFSNIPLGQKSSLQIASRKSLDDLVRTPTYDEYFERVTQETEAENNNSNVSNSDQDFDFYDVSFRWLYRPSDNNLLRFNFILINNELGFDETGTIDNSIRTRRSSVAQNTLAVGLFYKRQWNRKLSTSINIYNNDYKLEAQNADVLNNQRQLQENVVSETSIEINNKYKSDEWEFDLGYQFTETEVINLNDIDLPRFVRRNEEILRVHSPFAQFWYNSTNGKFSVRGGVRTNYITRFEKLIVEPRLSIRKSIGKHIQFEALGEFKHQNTSQIVNFQNDFLGIEKRRWQLADNDSIPILQSKQASVGISYRRKGWLVDTKGFFKSIDGITTQSQSFTTKYEFAREKGSYDAYGLECLIRKTFGNYNSWLSYSFINNDYTFDTLEGSQFPSNFDITHTVTFGTTYSNESWNISAGLNYRTGNPTSIPVNGNNIVDEEVNFANTNGERLIDYLRLDASAMYKFKISNTLKSEVGASIWNLTNRENAINDYYRISNNEVNRFSRFSLGLTTNVVFRILF